MNKDLKQLELARIALESGVAMVKVANLHDSDGIQTLSKVNMGIVAEILGNPNKEFMETVMDFPDLPEGEKWFNPNNVSISKIPTGMRLLTQTERDYNIYGCYYEPFLDCYFVSALYPIIAKIGTFQPKLTSK